MRLDKSRAIELRKLGHSYQEIADELRCSLAWCKKNLSNTEKGQLPRDIQKLHEVYVAYAKDGVLYVGSGEHGRHKHCKSYTSTSAELNKRMVNGPSFIVEVVKRNMTKEESLELEQFLITDLKPLYNIATKVVNNKKKELG